MRISEFLRATFVGALLFTPAMADDIEKVHEEALRVLRQKLGQANDDLPSPSVSPSTATIHAPALNADPETQRIRAEREARIKAEAERRLAEREKLQADRRQQFEAYVKQREMLREQQKAYDENAARETGQLHRSYDDEIHQRALAVLHTTETAQLTTSSAESSAPASTTTTTLAPQVSSAPATVVPPAALGIASSEPAPGNPEVTARALEIVRERKMAAASSSPARNPTAETAPRIMAAAAPASSASATSSALAQANEDAIHAQALEALHQLQNQPAPATNPAVTAPVSTKTSNKTINSTTPKASTTATTTNAPSNASQPSPELQKRLKQMQQELEEEQRQKMSAQPKPFTDDYVKGLEERARQSVQQGPLSTPVPGAAPTVGIHSEPLPSAGSNGLDAGTRDMIRRQDQDIARQMGAGSSGIGASNGSVSTQTPKATPAFTPAATASAPSKKPPVVASKPAAPVVTQRVESDTSNVQYSKELEERARQILAERAQNPPSASIQAATTPIPAAPSAPSVSAFATGPSSPSVPAAAIAAATAASQPAAAPIQAQVVNTAPTLAAPATEVHTQALQTLNQVQSGTGPQTKQQRLKDLTDLYRADKIGPAEYHQKRAQIIAEPL